MKEITVDYEVLEAQILRLTESTNDITDSLLDGLYNLLFAILEQKPFREAKDR